MRAASTTDGLVLLGAETQTKPARPVSLSSTALSIGVGTIAALAYPKHPVLLFLGTSALASNVHAVATGNRTWKEAARRIGRHIVAAAGSLALPSNPAVGYVAGAIAGDLLLDGSGGGIIEEWAHYAGVEWAHYAGVQEERPAVEVIDVTPIPPDHQTTALVKR
jgi:hypothetical protein